MRKLYFCLLALVAPLCQAENYLAGDISYGALRVENLATHNLQKVMPKYYEMFSIGYGYRTNSNWGFELGYQRNKKVTKTTSLTANQSILFNRLPTDQTITVTPRIIGMYMLAVGYHPLSTNSELIGQFGLQYSKIITKSNNNAFSDSSKNKGSLMFKAAFGYQHKLGDFFALRALIKYESTQSLKFAYKEAGSTYYFRPFFDTWGIAVGLLIRF